MDEPEALDSEESESLRVTRTIAVPELTDDEAKAAVEAALAHGGRTGLRVDVVFVDDPTLREMHERFLDDPTVTDVMAFDYTQAEDDAGSDPQAEVYVSVERARAVAEERGESSRDELLLYLVHGSLHLCGLDDHEERDRREMRAAERVILASLA